MARVYTSRQLIDPNLANYMEQVIQNRVANQLNRDKMLGESVRHMLTGIGETADDYIGRFQRQKELQNAEDNKNSLPYIEDPIYRAAREEYIRTGSSQPISSYMLQKEAAAARKADAKKAAEDKARTQEWHDSLEEGAARKEFGELTQQALDAQKAGNLVKANNLAKQANGLRERWSVRGIDIGDDVQSILKAAEQEEYEQWKKNYAAEEDKKEADKREQERLYNVEQFLSTIPTIFADDEEKEGWRNQINANEYMTTEEKTKTLQELRKIQTGKAAAQQARQNAQTQKAGEATGNAIDESRNKAAAKQYVGKKIDAWSWNKIPAEQKQYLKLVDGVVQEK